MKYGKKFEQNNEMNDFDFIYENNAAYVAASIEESDEAEELDVEFADEETTEQEPTEIHDVMLDVSTQFVKKLTKSKKKSKQEIAAELVAAYICDRTEKNWQNLYNFFYYGIVQQALKYVKNIDDAKDMAAYTFINAYEKIDTYDQSKGVFSTWLWTLCKNNCLGFLRNKKKSNIINNDISDIYDSTIYNAPAVQHMISISDKDEDPVQKLYDISINELKNFPTIEQEIITLKLVDNLKLREIAERLNINESTVKNHYYKSIENLERIIRINHKNEYDAYIDNNAARDEEQYL